MSAGDLVSGEIKHTATPWEVVDARICKDGYLLATCWAVIPVDVQQDGESWLDMQERIKPQRDASQAELLARAAFIGRACNEYDELKLKATHYDWLLNEARKTGVSVRFVNGGKDMCVGGIIDESIFDGLVSALKRMLDAFHEDPFENNTSGAVEEAYEALEKAGAVSGEAKPEPTIFDKFRNVKTMPELDALRLDAVNAMQAAGKASGAAAAYAVQKAFIKAQNRLRRIPLRDRTW